VTTTGSLLRVRRVVPALALAAALLGASAGCRHVSEEERQLMGVYLLNAAQYYDAGHYLRAYQQWGRVLEIEPDDEKALLGQGMAMYQMGSEETPESIQSLLGAEERLGELRSGRIRASWKAELGYGLVQLRWAELYARKLRKLEADAAAGTKVDDAAVDVCRAQIPDRVAKAEEAIHATLEDPDTEPNFHLTCWLALAKAATARGDWEATVEWAAKYRGKIVESKAFWSEQGKEYATKLLGAELQEVELRDTVANCLFKLGRLEDAEKELDLVLKLQPERTDAYLNRGHIRRLRGAWDLARSDLRQYLQRTTLPKDHPTALEAAKMLLECEDALAAEDAALRPGTSRP